MDKPNPSKRRSIRDKIPFEENADNIKNNAMVTRSKTLERAQQEMIDRSDRSDENGFSALSSDEDELFNEVQQRRGSKEHVSYARRRHEHKRNVSSGTEELDASHSPSRQKLDHCEPEVRNNLKQQLKKKGKTNRSSDSEKKQSIESKLTVKDNIKPHDTKGCYFWLLFFIIGLIFLAYILHLYYRVPDSKENGNIKVLKCGKDDIECITDDVKRTLKSMKAKYTNQDEDLWRNVFVGIKSIIHNPKKPSIIVLLGDETGFLDCLAVLLGNVSSNALSSGLMKLTPEKFESDMGTVITSLRSSIKDKKAVIVWDLLNINEEALKAFHNLCDRINPLVEEVIYIITIIADDYNERMSPLEFVEKKLYAKLSGKIKEDAIQPLITRITDGAILKVKPEPNLIDCPLPKVVK